MLPLHAPDTLFYVFEADFRASEQDTWVDTFALPSWVDPVHYYDIDAAASDRMSTYSRSVVHDQYERTKAYLGSEFLVQCTQFVTKCARVGFGELCWLGWNSVSDHSKAPGFAGKFKGKLRQQPYWGNQFISYTAKAAKYFLEHWEGAIAEPTFFDGALRRFLINEGHAEHIGASYAYPAFGGFKDHRSSNTPNNTPVCHWNNPDRQSGTFARSAHEKDVKRSIGKFVKKGPYQWLAEYVNIPDADLVWRTWSYSGRYTDKAGHLQKRVQHLVAGGQEQGAVENTESIPVARSKRQRRTLRKLYLHLGLRTFVDDCFEAGFGRVAICSANVWHLYDLFM